MDQSWINDISEHLQFQLLRKHPRAIKYVKNPTLRMIKLVIRTDYDAITKDINLCPESQLVLIQTHPDLFHVVSNPTPDAIKLALDLRPENIIYVEEPTEEQLLQAISKEPGLIYRFKLKNISSHIVSYAKMIM